MVTVFLLSRNNFIINLKPFNFYFGSSSKGPIAVYPFSSPARDSLFALGRIGRLTASFIILPNCLKILGY